MTVLLDDIVDALEVLIDDTSSYVDLDTGQVVAVSDDVLRMAEDDPPDRELPEWEEEELELARRIVSSDRFRPLPSKFDVHEWSIMRDFTESVETESIRECLRHAIHGTGAFRHFKHMVRLQGIEQGWFAFRTEALRRIAMDWCRENEIAWK